MGFYRNMFGDKKEGELEKGKEVMEKAIENKNGLSQKIELYK